MQDDFPSATADHRARLGLRWLALLLLLAGAVAVQMMMRSSGVAPQPWSPHRISGRVVDGGGAACVGTLVQADWQESTTPPPVGATESRLLVQQSYKWRPSTRTAADGSFTLCLPRGGDYHIEAVPMTHCSSSLRRVQVVNDRTTAIDDLIVGEPLGSIAGCLVDEHRSALAHWRISASRCDDAAPALDAGWRREVRSGDDGRFQLPLPRTGTFALAASHGLVCVDGPDVRAGDPPIEFRTTAAQRRGGEVSVRIDLHDRPMAADAVRVMLGQCTRRFSSSVEGDVQEGSWHWSELTLGRTTWVVAEPRRGEAADPGLAPALLGPFSLGAEPIAATLELQAWAVLPVLVVDRQGRPLADARLHFRVPGARGLDDFGGEQRTGADGRAELRLPPWRGVVEASWWPGLQVSAQRVCVDEQVDLRSGVNPLLQISMP